MYRKTCWFLQEHTDKVWHHWKVSCSRKIKLSNERLLLPGHFNWQHKITNTKWRRGLDLSVINPQPQHLATYWSHCCVHEVLLSYSNDSYRSVWVLNCHRECQWAQAGFTFTERCTFLAFFRAPFTRWDIYHRYLREKWMKENGFLINSYTYRVIWQILCWSMKLKFQCSECNCAFNPGDKCLEVICAVKWSFYRLGKLIQHVTAISWVVMFIQRHPVLIFYSINSS